MCKWQGFERVIMEEYCLIKQEMDAERADSLMSAHGNGERDVDNENINRFS